LLVNIVSGELNQKSHHSMEHARYITADIEVVRTSVLYCDTKIAASVLSSISKVYARLPMSNRPGMAGLLAIQTIQNVDGCAIVL
jgi:hypothetical protein